MTTIPQPASVSSRSPWVSHPVRIGKITPETPGVATYDLEFTDAKTAASYAFGPGQFNMLYLPGLGEIAVSVSGDCDERGSVPHTIRQAGNVTQALAQLPEGATIGLRGPFGSQWPVAQSRDCDVVFVAGGIGLAPLRPAIFQLIAGRTALQSITVLIGARDPSGLLFAREYDEWRSRGVSVQVTVDRPNEDWCGNIGMVTTLVDRIPLPRPENTVIMTCGPEVMMWYTVKSALMRGVPSHAVYVSLERNMNCAIGLCGHCQIGPEFLCKDGPVFAYARVASLLKVADL